MKVKFTLSNGQSFATKITYGFKDTRDLVENLSRMLGEATDKSVVELETEDGMFLGQADRHCVGRNPELKCLAPAEGALR
ncbi:hypothetical protein TM7x_02450 [Candidatus Nanosynbacter lyticus]|uniref:Uncharacterized protein n=1 Tax=Candidatus Nanosynbacter lyticus TaxID=2093824 RepID=A0A6S4GSC2_9BACT|nr:hypothetical protein TM7x_02450 [Candidatus Nanosynbacter lyticus]